MRAAKQHQRGASTAVLGPVFRSWLGSAATSTSSITNHSCTPSSAISAAPTLRSASLGCRVLDVVPLSVATGNITVSPPCLTTIVW